MLILSEIPDSTYLFDLYRNKNFLLTFEINEKEIATSEILPDFKDKRLTIILGKEGAKVHLDATKPVLVNGVACRRRTLKEKDILILGPYRLVFKGERREPESITIQPKKPRYKKKRRKTFLSVRHFLEAAAILASVSFLWYCTTQMPVQRRPEAAHLPIVSKGHEAPPPTEEKKEKIPKPSSGAGPHISLLTYAPHSVFTPKKLDMLFVHAHPDDETLDYGLYISKAVEAGKVIGVLTFTDGESGFDFYPDRDTTGIYPNKELHGKELAAVRVKEEERALKILGASVYIRLGLKNRPYTAVEVKKSIPTIIKEWGGNTVLVNKLNTIFTAFDPAVIVSPDGPSHAREHFEHEAVGYITARAVTLYRQKNPGKLQAYLKLVDVQQAEAYPEKHLRTIGFSEGNSDIVRKKRNALLQYETQADASYYGIKRLKNFPFEYYFIQYINTQNSAELLLDSSGRKTAQAH